MLFARRFVSKVFGRRVDWAKTWHRHFKPTLTQRYERKGGEDRVRVRVLRLLVLKTPAGGGIYEWASFRVDDPKLPSPSFQHVVKPV